MESWGVCEPVLKPPARREDHYPAKGAPSRDQNRTRENRPSGIVGGLVETWAMEMANRARTAETPKQTSHHLRPHTPHFYPDQRCTLSARSMPGDGQEHRLQPVLLPSHPSSGPKATNLLTWDAAPGQAKETNYPGAVGHMSTLVVHTTEDPIIGG